MLYEVESDETRFPLKRLFILKTSFNFALINIAPMKKETYSCVDCGTQNCKFKTRTYPDFCPTKNLADEDLQWALEKYDEDRNREIMIASAEVEFEGYCQWTRVQGWSQSTYLRSTS